MKGLCGDNDMRRIRKRSEQGDGRAQLAIEIFCYRLKKYVGAYVAALGGVDCLVFTGGIGENDSRTREQSLAGLDALGISIDKEKNRTHGEGIVEVQRKSSPCKILVVPTDEEFEIASQTMKLVMGESS